MNIKLLLLHVLTEWCVVKLEGMGFMREDCEIALATTNGNMDEAALWLTANASPIVEKKSTEGGITISGIEVSKFFFIYSGKKSLFLGRNI